MDGFELAKKLEENINSVFVGREEVVENLLVCLLGGGHVLLEDVPGVGHKAVHLRLGQWVCAQKFHRILSGNNHKRTG